MTPSYLDSIPAHDMTMTRLLERRARQSPGDVFFTWADTTTTVGDFNARVNQVARRLLAEGIGDGTHVAILMDSSPDYLALWFALAKINAVEIPINTAYRGDLLRHQLACSTATVCCVDSSYAGNLDEVSGQLPGLARMYVRGPAVPAGSGAAIRVRRAAGRGGSGRPWPGEPAR